MTKRTISLRVCNNNVLSLISGGIIAENRRTEKSATIFFKYTNKYVF